MMDVIFLSDIYKNRKRGFIEIGPTVFSPFSYKKSTGPQFKHEIKYFILSTSGQF